MRSRAIELFSYLTIGVIVASVYFGLIYLLIDELAIQYMIAVSISYVTAVSLHFILNRLITFKASSGRLGKQSFRYLGLLIINYTISLVIVYLSVSFAGFSPYFGACTAVIATFFSGYIISSRWVFKRDFL